jgi:hypothetical protein
MAKRKVTSVQETSETTPQRCDIKFTIQNLDRIGEITLHLEHLAGILGDGNPGSSSQSDGESSRNELVDGGTHSERSGLGGRDGFS